MKNYRDWDPKHNICAFLDENSKYSLNFRDIIRFLNRSRIKVAITKKTVPYISHIKSFWDNAEIDCTQEPPVIHSVVLENPIVISEALIRQTFELGDSHDQPYVLDDRLVRGCFKRMKYSGDINEKQLIRAKLSVQ